MKARSELKNREGVGLWFGSQLKASSTLNTATSQPGDYQRSFRVFTVAVSIAIV